jgi:ADP-ribose pyrophosphatase YjhB (NUDIX family)
VHREVHEELEIAIELGPLVGVYSRADSNIVLVVYAASTTDAPRTTAEAGEVRAFAPAELPWEELAFWSTREALRRFLGTPAAPH